MHRLIVGLLLLLLPQIGVPSNVKLENLSDFDRSRHVIGVNVHSKVSRGCRTDFEKLKESFELFLAGNNFRVGALENSHLEFAVSAKGFLMSDAGTCGIRLLSMVRQIPKMKVLRLSPGANSRRFRLWQTENVLTGPREDLHTLLEEQARLDVDDFSKVFSRLEHAQ